MKMAFFLSSLTILLAFFSCKDNDEDSEDPDLTYRNDMRSFVIGISQYSKQLQPGFIIIPQNGEDLATLDGTGNGSLAMGYINAIDGQGREELFYGFDGDDLATPPDERNNFVLFLDKLKTAGKTILATDYCSTPQNVDDAYIQGNNKGYISFAANHRELDNIPSYPSVINHQNQDSITLLSSIKNFLYLINPENFTKTSLINAIRNTDYDLVLVDLFVNDEQLTAGEVGQMKQKRGGGTRLVVCYMSIGEAEDYRYYWQAGWNSNKPAWLGDENPEWPGNYKVNYWDKSWQNIIFGNDQSYCKKILDAHFDGVYLDLIDAFEYFED